MRGNNNILVFATETSRSLSIFLKMTSTNKLNFRHLLLLMFLICKIQVFFRSFTEVNSSSNTEQDTVFEATLIHKNQHLQEIMSLLAVSPSPWQHEPHMAFAIFEAPVL